jgi:DNA-directed RNA polymerase specialized sigma24 family protein
VVEGGGERGDERGVGDRPGRAGLVVCRDAACPAAPTAVRASTAAGRWPRAARGGAPAWAHLRLARRRRRAAGPAQLEAVPSPAAALGYLRRCAVAALLDEARAQRARRARWAAGELAEGVAGARADEAVLEALDAAAVWRAVAAAPPDPLDRRVIGLVYLGGLRPGGLARRAPAAFPVVAEVYRRTRRALERLRRDRRLRAVRSGAA